MSDRDVKNVAAILLSAGRSRRMGRPKSLLPLGSRPAVVHCLDALEEAEIPTVLVVRQEDEVLVDLLRKRRVTVARNPDPESDMAGSVRTGLARLPEEATAALVHLVDHPLVRAGTLGRLAALHGDRPEAVLVPVSGGRRGHPTLFPLSILRQLDFVPTLRDLIRQNPERVLQIPVDDPGIFMDMDTPEDYRRLQAALADIPN